MMEVDHWTNTRLHLVVDRCMSGSQPTRCDNSYTETGDQTICRFQIFAGETSRYDFYRKPAPQTSVVLTSLEGDRCWYPAYLISALRSANPIAPLRRTLEVVIPDNFNCKEIPACLEGGMDPAQGTYYIPQLVALFIDEPNPDQWKDVNGETYPSLTLCGKMSDELTQMSTLQFLAYCESRIGAFKVRRINDIYVVDTGIF